MLPMTDDNLTMEEAHGSKPMVEITEFVEGTDPAVPKEVKIYHGDFETVFVNKTTLEDE